ncbi:hypothetical protein NKH77_34525 [Streptomyces sp. M19]
MGHDARERVLAHLATCCRCKQEADAQRRLKSVFAETAPPPPSEGLLARLQGLPGLAGGDDGDPPFGGPGALRPGGARTSVRSRTCARCPESAVCAARGGGLRAPRRRVRRRRARQGFPDTPGRAPGAATPVRLRRRRCGLLAAFALGAALPLDAAVDSPTATGRRAPVRPSPRSRGGRRRGADHGRTRDRAARRGPDVGGGADRRVRRPDERRGPASPTATTHPRSPRTPRSTGSCRR